MVKYLKVGFGIFRAFTVSALFFSRLFCISAMISGCQGMDSHPKSDVLEEVNADTPR